MANVTGTAASTPPRAASDDDDDAGTQAGSKRGVAVVLDLDDKVSAPPRSVPSSRAGSLAPAGGGRIKRAKKSNGPRVATIALADVEPEEMVGSPVTEQTTMGDLATVLVSEGRVSSRAIKIDEFRRAEMLQKKQDAQKRAEEMWRRNQIKRRKVRAAQNKERARRREQLRKQGAGGTELDDVSPDEMDSEEEFQVAPDRLTPPRSSSEEAHHHPVAADFLHQDDEEQVDQADEMFENMFDNNARPDSPGPQDVNAAALQEDDEQDDEAMAALRAAGFIITDDPTSHRPDDDDDNNNPWDDLNGGGGGMGEAFDVADYRLALQERRLREFREREQDDGDVVEVDDETRFVNSATYGKNRKSQRWSKMETELFYEILGETGENYTLMKAYFPGRDIRSLRLKGARENKVNPEKMTAAIMARKPLDKDYLAKSAGYDASRSWDKEEALFEEAKANVERLRKLDSEQPLGKDVSHQDQDQDVDEPHREGDLMRLDDDEKGLQRIEEVDVDVEEEEKSDDENDEYEHDEYI
ncbi:transcription factor TFIIIB component b'' [Cryptococcus deuterogattii 99/473]|uniref:Transcription factor TFIIIB component b n=1 Tax=Cryptococcus deuterogattii Ram5 TaxID=1296110 RepID=A0A0D0T468_9TREE|nr:transcription factor TFIIIB component b'' [Cryptococcus deuterogattii Ram5]KIY54571.1 transcription factor TFIIIB component b'' [Cryptococcus deuterogattii 99/473]